MIQNKPTASITENSISVYYNGTLYPPINSTHQNFTKIKEAIKNGNWEIVPKLLDITTNVKKYLSAYSDVELVDGVVMYKGKVLDNAITTRIMSLMKEGFEFKHLLNFIAHVQNNPSYRAVQELYKFLEHKSMPITEDGCFLAYKAVKNNYKDIYSGTFDNSIGSKPEVPRNSVDEDKARHCSSGLHVGVISYVKQYGHFGEGEIREGHNRLMIVKVNPADAVCVPEDHGCTKLRVCKYEVIGEIKDLQKILDGVVYTANATEMEPDLETDFDYENDSDNPDLDCEDEYECCDSSCGCAESNQKDYTPEDLTFTDDDYFIGRDDGQHDKAMGDGYSPRFSDSKRYMRGYRNGYENNKS